MKVLAILPGLLALLLIQGAEVNPPAPELLSIIRNKTHAELRWRYGREVLRFQLNRQDRAETLELHQCRIEHLVTGETFYSFLDKKLDKDTTYRYTVMAFTPGGTSLESNALEIKP